MVKNQEAKIGISFAAYRHCQFALKLYRFLIVSL